MLLFNILGNLYITADANLFLHRDGKVDDRAPKSELQISLEYSRHWKWR